MKVCFISNKDGNYYNAIQGEFLLQDSVIVLSSNLYYPKQIIPAVASIYILVRSPNATKLLWCCLYKLNYLLVLLSTGIVQRVNCIV